MSPQESGCAISSQAAPLAFCATALVPHRDADDHHESTQWDRVSGEMPQFKSADMKYRARPVMVLSPVAWTMRSTLSSPLGCVTIPMCWKRSCICRAMTLRRHLERPLWPTSKIFRLGLSLPKEDDSRSTPLKPSVGTSHPPLNSRKTAGAFQTETTTISW